MLRAAPVLPVAVAIGCTSTTAPSVAPTVPTTLVPTATPASTPASQPTAAPTVLPFPELSEQDLEPGLYDSSPPFAVAFTFLIPDEGWHSAHIHGDFFDVMRFDGPEPRTPTRWVAFGFPMHVRGPNGSQPVGDLTPAEAIELMSTVPNVVASNAQPFAFAGRDGMHVDLTTDTEMTQIFGGDAGDFALDPAFDVRLGAVEHEPGLLLVMCFGPSGDLEEGCADVQPIIDSVELV